MCGIVGYIGRNQDAQQVILDALRRLEYRGYDSAGIAIFERGAISIRRAVGKLGNLESALRDRPIAGDIPAMLPCTRQMLFLEDGEFAVISEDAVQVLDRDGRPIDREPRAIQWDPVSAEKGGYDRFMQKEIFEQPRAITDTIGTRVLEAEG